MVKMGAREFVYPNFGYRSRWLRNRDPVYSFPVPFACWVHDLSFLFALRNGCEATICCIHCMHRWFLFLKLQQSPVHNSYADCTVTEICTSPTGRRKILQSSIQLNSSDRFPIYAGDNPITIQHPNPLPQL